MDVQHDSERADCADLQGFGYSQDLMRSLGSFSSFAAGFSYISILTGMFQMFYLGFAAGGPAFFWTWPMVLAGQLLIALCFAELAAHYPLSGGVYQWSKQTGNAFTGFMTGWIYLGCLVVTLAAVALALQAALPQISSRFQLVATVGREDGIALNAVLLGCLLLLASTIINSFGVRLLAAINNVGVLSELTGVVLLIVLLAMHPVRSPQSAVFETLSKGAGVGYIDPFLAAAALTASYVLYGFDTAGSLAEETHDPRRRAPRAILQALSAAGLAGLLVLLFAITSVPNLKSESLSSADGGLPYIVKEVLGGQLGRLFLCDVAFAIFVCSLAVHTGTIRVVFAMARDSTLPFSRWLCKVSESTHAPVLPAVVTGVGAMLILVVNIRFPKIVELVTAVAILWANLAYLLVVTTLLRRRFQGWPKDPNLIQGRRAFSLGRMGLPVNILAVLWSLFMVINVGWPRAAIYGEANRFSGVTYTILLIGIGAVFFRFGRSREAKPSKLTLASTPISPV